MNERFGKDLYNKGISVKRSWPFSELPDSKIEKLLSSSPSRQSDLNYDDALEACWERLAKKS